ncbi:MAG: DUF1570 domain-containing protein, partial [Armatimonadetes bacterium]|nr:DUF1570 domain-containing protein [Armatimonadota bacterium]
ANKQKALKQADRIRNSLDRARFINTIERQVGDVSEDAILSTTMHEAAHQIAFNCGLLQRDAGGPCWLVEGMAIYCESTDQGDWTALGSPNPLRIAELTRVKGNYIPLQKLIENDQWRGTPNVLLGYGQSWALFRLLMEEQTPQLQAYLRTLATRKTSEYRVADFRAAFGNDLTKLETRYQRYMDEVIRRHPAAKVR